MIRSEDVAQLRAELAVWKERAQAYAKRVAELEQRQARHRELTRRTLEAMAELYPDLRAAGPAPRRLELERELSDPSPGYRDPRRPEEVERPLPSPPEPASVVPLLARTRAWAPWR